MNFTTQLASLQTQAQEDPESVIAILANQDDVENLAIEANAQYRAGTPIVTDWFYDHVLMRAVEQVNPESDLLFRVEPDAFGGKTVRLPQRMLSTQKAYTFDIIEKWAEGVLTAASQFRIGASELVFRVTPKLDGFAAYDDGTSLYTRGDGRSGTDITRVFDRGVGVAGHYNESGLSNIRGLGKGEIVVDKAYFASKLAAHYENSRNVISSVIKEGELDSPIKLAVEQGKIIFVPFQNLQSKRIAHRDLIGQIDKLWNELVLLSPYDTDGLVIEAIEEPIKELMGDTGHHHRWQIAYKRNDEVHLVPVLGLIPQTSKSGRITPVVSLEPTKVSGVTISRANGHHYGNVIKSGIDTGAVVELCRSGLVIPFIKSVVTPASTVNVITHCPSCAAPTELVGDNLMCTNTETCPAQIERIIEYFFKTLGNNDGFGPKNIEKICAYLSQSGKDLTFAQFYSLGVADFLSAGFGQKTADNLTSELLASRSRPIEDWRFLAAFGISSIGKGGCEQLLRHHRLADVFSLTVDDIILIDDFAEKTATILVDSLVRIKSQFDYLQGLGFNLLETAIDDGKNEKAIGSPIKDKIVVFTGSMQLGNRDDMKKQAKHLGAKVSDAVSSKTDYLVCGDKVGAAKIAAARKNNTIVLTEGEYFELLV